MVLYWSMVDSYTGNFGLELVSWVSIWDLGVALPVVVPCFLVLLPFGASFLDFP